MNRTRCRIAPVVWVWALILAGSAATRGAGEDERSRPATAASSENAPAEILFTHQLPLRLIGTDPETVHLLPIDVVFSIKASELEDPHRELRLLYQAERGDRPVPVPVSYTHLTLPTNREV